MADFKGRKRGKSHVQNMGIFLVAQDMVLSHRAKFQLIINFFRVKDISTELLAYLRKFFFTKTLVLSYFLGRKIDKKSENCCVKNKINYTKLGTEMQE